jgi:hypothetical protein
MNVMETVHKTRGPECAYSFIGDSGAVTREELVAFLGTREAVADAWLRRRVTAGYLFRDEFGTYSTSCPWPRVGF